MKFSALLLVGVSLFAQAPPAADRRMANNDPETIRRTQWFREAKFGMLITWGLYSIPAGEWKGVYYPGIGEWLMNWAKIPVAEYAQLATQFNPVKFNADEWVAIAERAGMKYIVPMPKHHDGFALFDSKASPYNVVAATPFKRDPMKELADASKKRNMRMGFYYSQAQDWHHPGGAIARGGSWDPAQNGNFDDYLDKIAVPQVRELLIGYGPIALLWFDTPMYMSQERADKLVKLVRELQPDCLINGRLRLDNRGYDYASMGDNQVPEGGFDNAWETPATINDTWAFKTRDTNWKPADTLIYRMVDIVSKGGNYLLNVGPTAEGVIPEPSVKVLEEMGAWLKVNGESIYGASRTPFGAELKGTATLDHEFKYQKPGGWRCTQKPGKLYIHRFEWSSEFKLEGVKAKVQRASLLADPAHKALKFKQTGESVTFTLPAAAPGKYANVIAISYKGDWPK
jgi:alpha-L-fucosidase